MWQAFKDDIECVPEFENREDYENYVKGWVEDSISECGRIERYYLKLENPEKELDIKIKETENDSVVER